MFDNVLVVYDDVKCYWICPRLYMLWCNAVSRIFTSLEKSYTFMTVLDYIVYIVF